MTIYVIWYNEDSIEGREFPDQWMDYLKIIEPKYNQINMPFEILKTWDEYTNYFIEYGREARCDPIRKQYEFNRESFDNFRDEVENDLERYGYYTKIKKKEMSDIVEQINPIIEGTKYRVLVYPEDIKLHDLFGAVGK